MIEIPLVPLVVVGHVIRTTSALEDDLATAQISGLWERTFFDTELTEWYGRLGAEFYGLYFGYEGGHDGAYSFIAGVGARTLTEVPSWWSGAHITDEPRVAYTAPGIAPQSVINVWKTVWADTENGTLRRAFTTDVEVYNADGTAEVLVAGSRKLLVP